MWDTAYFCVKCDGELLRMQRYYNNGRCPHCGYKDRHAGTIVAYYEKPFEWVEVDKPWWKFWEPSHKRVFDEPPCNKL